MARIPDDELERLKRDISLERLVESKGIMLEKRGHDRVGVCPFHDDKGPSFVVTPAKNVFHCFGCGAGGSVVDFVMKVEGMSFRHAIELLRAGHMLAPSTSSTTVALKQSSVPKLPTPVPVDAGTQEALDQVTSYYHSTLKESPEALAYLESRGLSSSELIDHFKLGYGNRTLGLRLPRNNRLAGAHLRGLLQQVGVIRESGHEHMNGSLVVPIVDEQGHTVGMYGRKLLDTLRPGTPMHLYLPGPHRGVFNAAGLSSCSEVILCEALIDALTFWAAGFRNVTSSYGVEGFTSEMLATFHAKKIETVLIAYDRDDAGDRAADALAVRLVAEGFRTARVQFPKGMDANAYAMKVKPASKSLGLALERAQEQLLAARGVVVRAPAVVISAAARAVVDDGAAKDEHPLVAASAPLVLPAASVPAVSVTSSTVPPASPAPMPALRLITPPIALASMPGTSSPTSTVECELKDDEIVMRIGDRRYRVRGFDKNTSHDVLRVNLHVSRGDAFHVDTLDLYAARFRAVFTKLAAHEFAVDENVIKKDLGRVLLKLEELQDASLRALLEPSTTAPTMTDEEQEEALALLRDPQLLDRILVDFARCGVVGEESNKLVGYLAMTSRKLEQPLAVIIQSSSAAGKSSLMEAVLAFCPDEDKTKYSAMTGQSLFYMSESDLKHKVLAVVEEEGAERASYALKLLQSEGELTIASTGKDPETGKLVTSEYHVEGPVMLFLTTTAIDIDEELMNRCLVLTVDEERAQTRAIHKLQRERRTLQGLLSRREKDAITALHMNVQRLVRPLPVVNPYAEKLTFLDDKTRTRRDHMKYLGLIEVIALVHQHQRATKTVEHRGQSIEYVEVMLADIAIANRLAHGVLGRSLDELPPQTRKFLMQLDAHVVTVCESRALDRSDVRLTRREILDITGAGYTQVRVHLDRLIALEHVIVHQGGRGQSFVYELVYDGQGKDSTPFLPGLFDVAALAAADAAPADVAPAAAPATPPSEMAADETTTLSLRGSEGEFAGDLRPIRGAFAGTSRGSESEVKPHDAADLEPLTSTTRKNGHLGPVAETLSYLRAVRSDAE